ncbi:hypothetical protein [Sphingopyxis chilensis]
MHLPNWSRGCFKAAATSGAKPDLAFNLDEARPVAFLLHIPQRLFAAFGIMVDTTGDEPAHFFVGKDQIVGAVDAHAKFLAGPFDELDEIPIANIHKSLRHRVPEINLPMQTITEK